MQAGRPQCFTRKFEELSAWQRKLKGFKMTSRFDHARFFQKAFELVQMDVGIMQDVVELLAKDQGLAIIKKLIDTVADRSIAPREDTIKRNLLPLFNILCYPNVASSNVLETPVVTIYNWIYGPNGSRAATFLPQLVAEMTTNNTDFDIDQFDIVIGFFTRLALLNDPANLNGANLEHAKKLIDRALEITVKIQGSQHFSIRRTADRLNRHFELGKNVNLDHSKGEAEITKKAKFVHSQKPPGGRHDNDFDDIRKIKIMPTYDEIISKEAEYLPSRTEELTTNLTPLQTLFDRHFRLLREDTIGQLRDTVGQALDDEASAHDTKRLGGLRTHVYENLTFLDVFVTTRGGVEFFVRVDTPEQARRAVRKKEWWEALKRLQIEALVCIVGLQDSITYCTVSAQGPPSVKAESPVGDRDRNQEDTKLNHQVERRKQFKGFSLWGDHLGGAYLTLKLVSTSSDDLMPLLAGVMSSKSIRGLKLVEFPGILLPAFQPTLVALQNMYGSEDMPFADILAAGYDDELVLEPPAYTQTPGFSFDLACITDTPDQPLPFSPSSSFDHEILRARSSLDEAQAYALTHALSSSLALIQGPPGTGKSYTGVAVIRALLQVQELAELGPIICVCYTNHALDQLLESLHAAGIHQMIRIGSRSKSQILQDISLSVVSQTAGDTRKETNLRNSKLNLMRNEAEVMADLIQRLHTVGSISSIKLYLQENHPSRYNEIFEEITDIDGFDKVIPYGGDPLQSWLRGNASLKAPDPLPSIEVLQEIPSASLSPLERTALYDSWIQELRSEIANEILASHESFQEHTEKYYGIQRERNLRCLKSASIIGVTTSGLARQLDMLRKLPSKVLVCEEAGEVLEANLLPALLPSLEHTILIGDHLQLRPQTQNYELSRDSVRGQRYALDLSLFERLVQDPFGCTPALPYRTLEIQRRMDPSISRLIKETLYPNLRDHISVSKYPTVSGIKERLFWLDHDIHEDSYDVDHAGSTSRSNAHEVAMVTSLVLHLVRQGVYQPADIAVLTPYLAQFFKIRRELAAVMEVSVDDRDLEIAARQGFDIDGELGQTTQRNTAKTTLLKAVRVASVDNFQGEEAKVVIVSLVRSNDRRNCGFLRTSNRINVLLSRAKHGMYIIGNSATARSVPMWSDVVNMLKENGNIGKQLILQCPRHPEIATYEYSEAIIGVSKPEDFSVLAPEGGCNLMCGKRLLCGHACHQKCHATNIHDAVQCLQSCPNLLPCGHLCANHCGEPCTKQCETVVKAAIVLPCGHTLQNPMCWQIQAPESVSCTQPVMKELPGCKHVIEVKCATEITDTFQCTKKCDTVLTCGHSCRRPCATCCPAETGRDPQRAFHAPCSRPCERSYESCGHDCTLICHESRQCPPCESACETICAHSKCTNRCSDPCVPCISPTCAASCPHGKCSMPCAAACDRIPCSEPCTKLLSCGHACSSLCGEICPSSKFCQVCVAPSMDPVTEEDPDKRTELTIVPPCGHALTVAEFDKTTRMHEFYELGTNGKILRLVQKDPDLSLAVPRCSTCRTPLLVISRCGRIAKEALLTDMTKDFISRSNRQYTILAQYARSLQEQLMRTSGSSVFPRLQPIQVIMDGKKDSHVAQIAGWSQTKRYQQICELYIDVHKYGQMTARREQPFRILHEAVQRIDHSGSIPRSGFGTFLVCQGLLTHSLLIRCHVIILSDFFQHAPIDPISSVVDLTDCWESCTTLASFAQQATQPIIQAEAYLFYAQYCVIAQSCLVSAAQQLSETGQAEQSELDEMLVGVEDLKNMSRQKLRLVEEIQRMYPRAATHLTQQLASVRQLIEQSVVRQVRESAMPNPDSSTSRWHCCLNLHLFLASEDCTSCPQCNARVRGQNSDLTSNNTRTSASEKQMQEALGVTSAGSESGAFIAVREECL